MHWASAKGLAGTVAKLLALGADAALTDKDGNTALELARTQPRWSACVCSRRTMPDITDENKNALLLRYARLGARARLRAVLQAGANAAHTDENGYTALMLACENKHEAAAAELMEATKRAGALDLQAALKWDRQSSSRRCTWPVTRAWRARWRSSWRSVRMPRLQTGMGTRLLTSPRGCTWTTTTTDQGKCAVCAMRRWALKASRRGSGKSRLMHANVSRVKALRAEEEQRRSSAT